MFTPAPLAAALTLGCVTSAVTSAPSVTPCHPFAGVWGFPRSPSLLISGVSPPRSGCSGRLSACPQGHVLLPPQPAGSVKVTSVKSGAGAAQLCRVLADVQAAPSVTACGLRPPAMISAPSPSPWAPARSPCSGALARCVHVCPCYLCLGHGWSGHTTAPPLFGLM